MNEQEVDRNFKDWIFEIKDLFLPYIRHRINTILEINEDVENHMEILKKHISKTFIDIIGNKIFYLQLDLKQSYYYTTFSERRHAILQDYIKDYAKEKIEGMKK